MPDETLITVRGEAHAEAEPEIAVLDVSVTARDRDRVRAVETLGTRTRDLGALISGSGDGTLRLASKPVRVQPLFKEGKIRSAAIGFLAQGGFTVTVSDFGLLGDLVGALACEDFVALAGPSWQLRPDSPVYREVRMAAARDSLQRARDYAEAYGGRIVGLAEAADSGLLGHLEGGGQPRFASRAVRSAMPGDDGEPSEIDLFPAVQTVYAQVEARFLMTRPALAG